VKRSSGRVDANHPTIVKELRDMGYSVLSLADLGKGKPDILVGTGHGTHGMNLAVEIKDPAKPLSKRQLTDDERVFHAIWRGPLIIAETTEEIVAEMKRLTS
jgi:hypothetical protein